MIKIRIVESICPQSPIPNPDPSYLIFNKVGLLNEANDLIDNDKLLFPKYRQIIENLDREMFSSIFSIALRHEFKTL